jgi:hypothetical protein
MSWRIEQTDPLYLLHELPDSWVQACITAPPRHMPVGQVLTVLDQVHRGLRDDGTVWLSLRGYPDAHELIWQLRRTSWLRPARPHGTPKQTLLLAKHTGFLFTPPYRLLPRVWWSRRLECMTAATVSAGCRRCSDSDCSRRPRVVERRRYADAALDFRAVEWCVLASTTRRACHICGASTLRAPVRPRCAHTVGRGQCLILDPFCHTGRTGLVSVRYGRHYLGIEPDPIRAQIARRDLARLERER